MKKKIIIPIIFGVILFITGCVNTSEDNTQNNINSDINTSTESKITIIKNNINLGEIPMSKGKVKIPFEFKNTGNTNISLGEGETSCMCTEAIISNIDGNNPSGIIKMRGHGAVINVGRIVKPGEKILLTAIYDPNAHGPNATGPISRDVYIQTNSENTPVLKFNFYGNVVK